MADFKLFQVAPRISLPSDDEPNDVLLEELLRPKHLPFSPNKAQHSSFASLKTSQDFASTGNRPEGKCSRRSSLHQFEKLGACTVYCSFHVLQQEKIF